MKEILNHIQSPKTIMGKGIRDGIQFAIAHGIIVFLQSFDTIDFGEYNPIITAVIGFAIVSINRYTRT